MCKTIAKSTVLYIIILFFIKNIACASTFKSTSKIARAQEIHELLQQEKLQHLGFKNFKTLIFHLRPFTELRLSEQLQDTMHFEN